MHEGGGAPATPRRRVSLRRSRYDRWDGRRAVGKSLEASAECAIHTIIYATKR